ncbi:unnamed protein product [Parascedosporium putredinis]|uniref:FAD-binding domain-containing protein n=1 Tax=Parascedosporium putredinis TaxID=1442378 RepID=A0A9P1H0K3_9PEZI|nr:unnamed protein product [Parascedosporium putredinis]CAI7991852.1 unnamed protein product [Parascedosporium putredinis]
MARLNILINGAGIAGNALAFWLTKLGHKVRVVERFPSLRTTGLQLDLRGHAIPLLKRMGLEKVFRQNMAPEQGMQIVGSSGRRWAYFPGGTTSEGLQAFSTEWEIMRGDLCRILYDACRENAVFAFGTGIESYKQVDKSVEVQFTDGTTDTFDLVVEGEEYIATAYVAPGGKGVMTRRTSANQLQVYLTCRTDSAALKTARNGDIEAEKAGLAQEMRGSGWITDEFLDALPEAQNFYCERLGLVDMKPWYDGHVVLVGDAGYCPSVLTGMGTTCAFMGAYILAGEIGKHCGSTDKVTAQDGISEALRAYDEKFRPYMDKIHEGVAENSDWWPKTSFGILMMNMAAGIASLLRINLPSKFVSKEDIKGWDLPEYEELGRF